MSKGATAEQEQRFWERYIKSLNDQGINQPADRWHVVWAERYIRAFPGLRLADHTGETVSGYLETVGRQRDLKPWQYRQAIVAIRNLFSVVKPEWFGEFDWDYRLGSAPTLETDHPTVAREPRQAATGSASNPRAGAIAAHGMARAGNVAGRSEPSLAMDAGTPRRHGGLNERLRREREPTVISIPPA